MFMMYALVTILVITAIWSLSEKDKAQTTVTSPAPALKPVSKPARPLDPWERVQRRLDRDCGTAVLPDLIVDGQVKEVILAVNDQGAFLLMRTPGQQWVEVAHEDIATSDYVRWAKARWTAMGGNV